MHYLLVFLLVPAMAVLAPAAAQGGVMPEGIPVEFGSSPGFLPGTGIAEEAPAWGGVSQSGGKQWYNLSSGPQGIRIDQRLQRLAVISPARSGSEGGAAQPGGAGLFLRWPVKGRLTSGFGWREGGFHHGIDLAENIGEPIRAAAAGKVIFAGWRPVYGKTVIIDHGNSLLTLYAHAHSLMVQQGECVSAGEIIALLGSSGRSSGPHLHFEVYWQGKVVDPLGYLPPAGNYAAEKGSMGGG